MILDQINYPWFYCLLCLLHASDLFFFLPAHYCGFLAIKSLICNSIRIFLLESSRYALLLCPVYLSEMHVLFVSVSVHRPDVSYPDCFNPNLFFFVLLSIGSFLKYEKFYTEFRVFRMQERKRYFIYCTI